MKEVLFEMTSKRLGLTTVVEPDGTLSGSSRTATCAGSWSGTATRSSTRAPPSA
jgi:hypothetical protein